MQTGKIEGRPMWRCTAKNNQIYRVLCRGRSLHQEGEGDQEHHDLCTDLHVMSLHYTEQLVMFYVSSISDTSVMPFTTYAQLDVTRSSTVFDV
jgi:hypothetical protein